MKISSLPKLIIIMMLTELRRRMDELQQRTRKYKKNQSELKNVKQK